MKSGKRVLSILLVSLLLIISIGLVSAGLKDWFGFGNKDKDLEGELPQNAPAAVVVKNIVTAPIVVFVSNVSDGVSTSNNVAPNIRGVGAGNTNVSFYFLAQQGGAEYGNLDIIPGSKGNATAIFNYSTDIQRINMSCTTKGQVNWAGGTAANYSCTVVMRFYDRPAVWSINATVKDPKTFKTGTNLTKTFTVTPVYSATISTYYLNWTSIETTTTNAFSDNDPNITNDANGDYSTVSVNATYLNGTVTSTEAINPQNFSVNKDPIADCVTGAAVLVPKDNVAIPSFSVSRQQTDTLVQTEFYICLKGPLSGLSSQTYKSQLGHDWIIKLAVLISIKRKKKLKTRSKLLSHEELLGLDLLLKSKYDTNVRELLKEAREKQIREEFEIKSEIKIPLNIFNKELSPAEVLCKYLKENKKMKFSEIAKLINRDERSIWTNYNNAIRKMREKIKDEKKTDKIILVSINLFADRRLSVLESVVKYLKEKAYKNSEIAELLGKDQRNIYTVYKRVKKKLE